MPAKEAVRCQLRRDVAVRCKRIKRVGSGRAKARQRPRSTNWGDRNSVRTFQIPTVPTEQPRRECTTREQGHQGNYLTDSPRLRPRVDEEKTVAVSAKR